MQLNSKQQENLANVILVILQSNQDKFIAMLNGSGKVVGSDVAINDQEKYS